MFFLSFFCVGATNNANTLLLSLGYINVLREILNMRIICVRITMCPGCKALLLRLHTRFYYMRACVHLFLQYIYIKFVPHHAREYICIVVVNWRQRQSAKTSVTEQNSFYFILVYTFVLVRFFFYIYLYIKIYVGYCAHLLYFTCFFSFRFKEGESYSRKMCLLALLS